MSQPPQFPPGDPPPGGAPPGGWGTPLGPGGPPGSGGFPPPGGGPGSPYAGGGPGGPYGGPTGRSNTPVIVVVVVIAVALIGGSFFLLTQGDDDRSEEEQAYIDAMTEAGLANQDGDQLRLDENEARCFATAVVDTFGVETLLEEASPEEIRSNPENDPLEDIEVSLQHAEGIYDSTSGCIDYRDLLMASLEEGSGLSSEQLDCVNRSLSDEHVRDLLVAQLAQDDDASAEAGATADEATEDCNLPE